MDDGRVPTLLIVEDEALIAMELEAIASEAGYIALSSRDHAQALASLQKNRIDFALLDGGPDWIELARMLRSQGVPFAFCTGASTSSIPPEFNDVPFIAKPFQHEDVRSILTSAKANSRGGLAGDPGGAG